MNGGCSYGDGEKGLGQRRGSGGPTCGGQARTNKSVTMVSLLDNLDNWTYQVAIYQVGRYTYWSRFGREDNEPCFSMCLARFGEISFQDGWPQEMCGV